MATQPPHTADGESLGWATMPLAFGSNADRRLTEVGPYRVLTELGRGNMGVVYLAESAEDRRQVALKTLLQISAATLQRFKQEFRSLAGITHPNLVQLQELVFDGRIWYFTMEFVEGVEFLQYVRYGLSPDFDTGGETVLFPAGDADALARQEQARFERIRAAFRQLAEGLQCLHRHGILHRDIKPSNVRVAGDGRVVLLDFGLAAELDKAGLHESMQILGTPAYMSPEQAASQPVSKASDWYAFGVMLFQALTDRLPFDGPTVQVLLDKQNKAAPAPSDVRRDVPRDLHELCVGLLSQSWVHRPTGEDVLRVLSDRATDAVSIVADVAAEAEAPALVGRDASLALLRAAYAEMEQGRPVSVLVSGRSGMGKSALVEALLDSLSGDRVVVLSGRCYEQESVPFKALDSLIDSLARFLNSRRLTAADVEGLMPRDIALLARLFPVLGQIKAVAAAPRRTIEIPDQQELKRRAIGALRELLGRLGDRWPVAVYVDDLQWGDEDSAAMLADLLQPPDAPVMFFVGTYRAEDEERSPFLRALREIRRQRGTPFELRELSVEPLTPSESVALALARLGSNSDDARARAEAIAHDAGGNPFFIAEMARFAAAGVRDAESATNPSLLDAMIWRRAQRLPGEAMHVLGVVAVAGQPLPIETVLAAADATVAGPHVLGRLRTENLVRTIGGGHESTIECYHDRIREAVAQNLPPDLKRHLHRRLAELLESLSGLTPASLADDANVPTQRVYDLAIHFDAAGDSPRALAYSLFAAAHARAQFALEIAERQYRIAERNLADSGAATEYRVREGLGDVLMLRGSYPDAAAQFNRILPGCQDDRTRAHIEGKLGEVAFKQGDLPGATRSYERALRLLGRPVPRHFVTLFAQVLWEVAAQTLHTCAPRWFLHRRGLEGAERDLTIMRILARLTYAYWFSRGKLDCFWAHIRNVNLAELYPPTAELAHAYSIHAPVMTLLAMNRRALAYADRAIAIHTTRGDRQGQGQALHFRGVALYGDAQFENCVDTCSRAVSLLEQTGDYWEVNVARYHILCSLCRLGRMNDATAAARRLHRSATELGDIQMTGMPLGMWALATGGKIPEDVLQGCEQTRDRIDVQTTAQVLQGIALCRIAEERFEDAIVALEETCRSWQRAGVKNAYTVPTLSWLVTAKRLFAERDPARNARRWTEADATAAQAVRAARLFRAEMPHVLRERAIICARVGKASRSQALFEESLRVARQQNARFEEALSLIARAEIGKSLGRPTFETDMRDGCALLDQMELSDEVRSLTALLTRGGA